MLHSVPYDNKCHFYKTDFSCIFVNVLRAECNDLSDEEIYSLLMIRVSYEIKSGSKLLTVTVAYVK